MNLEKTNLTKFDDKKISNYCQKFLRAKVKNVTKKFRF